MDPLLMTANQIGAEVIDDLVKLTIEESGYKQRLNFLQKSVEKSQRELQKTKEEAQKIEQERIRIEEERIEIEEQKVRNKIWRQNKDSYEDIKNEILVQSGEKKKARLTVLEKYARKKILKSLASYKYSVAKSVYSTPELNLNLNISSVLQNETQNKGIKYE